MARLQDFQYGFNIASLDHKQFLLGAQFLLNRINFSLGTQAFVSPPDMASSGLWEIVILTKTPTFEGVCGMLYFIIFLNFCQMFDFVDRW